MIEDIMPIYLGRFSGNCYLLRTEQGFILIDTGMKGKGKELEKVLLDSGCVPGKLDLIMLTHGHFDHTANCKYMREVFDSKVAMHPGDHAMVEEGDMFVNRKTNIFAKKLVNSLFGVEKFRPDIGLDEDTDLSEFGFDARVIHIPGHSKGSIAILTKEGHLFCGDILNNTKKPEAASMAEDFEEMERSMEKLKEFDIGTVYPGHGKPFPMSAFLY